MTVCMLLCQSEKSHSQVSFARKKGPLKAGTYWGLSFYILTVTLYTVSAQTLLSLISKSTIELNRCILFSTISVFKASFGAQTLPL